MITTEQAKSYLASKGVDIPDFVIEVLVDEVNSIDQCLVENYGEGRAKLVQLYLITLLGLAQSVRYIASQSAPSGASRSFRYEDFNMRWNGTLSLIHGIDKEGCSNHLIPDNPSVEAYAGLWVASANQGV